MGGDGASRTVHSPPSTPTPPVRRFTSRRGSGSTGRDPLRAVHQQRGCLVGEEARYVCPAADRQLDWRVHKHNRHDSITTLLARPSQRGEQTVLIQANYLCCPEGSSQPKTPTKPRPFPACPDVLEPTRQIRKRLAQSAGPLRPSMAVSPPKKKVFFNNVLMVTSSPSPHIPPCCLHTRVASPKGREIGVGMARETGVMCCVLMS